MASRVGSTGGQSSTQARRRVGVGANEEAAVTAAQSAVPQCEGGQPADPGAAAGGGRGGARALRLSGPGATTTRKEVVTGGKPQGRARWRLGD